MLVVPYALGLFCSHIAVSQVLDHRNLFITQSNASEAWKWRWQTCQVVEGRFRTKANIRWPLLWIYCKLTARVIGYATWWLRLQWLHQITVLIFSSKWWPDAGIERCYKNTNVNVERSWQTISSMQTTSTMQRTHFKCALTWYTSSSGQEPEHTWTIEPQHITWPSYEAQRQKNWRNAVKLWSKCFSEATCSIRKIRKWTMDVSNPFSNIISLSHSLATHCHQFNEGNWHCIAGIAKIQGTQLHAWIETPMFYNH